MDTQTDAREWVVASGGNLPHKVLAEVDPATGEKFYVGHGKYKEELLPGKVGKKGLYVVADGAEHLVKDYEVLISTKPVTWESEKNGGYPSNAVQCGNDKYSNKLYIARVDATDKKKCVGIFNPIQRECVFCHNGKMANSNKYEVLAEKD